MALSAKDSLPPVHDIYSYKVNIFCTQGNSGEMEQVEKVRQCENTRISDRHEIIKALKAVWGFFIVL